MTYLFKIFISSLVLAIAHVCAGLKPEEGAYRLAMGTLYLALDDHYVGAPLRFGAAIESRLWQVTVHGTQFHIQSSDFGYYVGYEAAEAGAGLFLTKKPKAAWDMVLLDNNKYEIRVPGQDLVIGQLPMFVTANDPSCSCACTCASSRSTSVLSSSLSQQILARVALTIPDKEGFQAWRLERFTLLQQQAMVKAMVLDGDYEILLDHTHYLQRGSECPGGAVVVHPDKEYASVVWQVRSVQQGDGRYVTIQDQESGLYLSYDRSGFMEDDMLRARQKDGDNNKSSSIYFVLRRLDSGDVQILAAEHVRGERRAVMALSPKSWYPPGLKLAPVDKDNAMQAFEFRHHLGLLGGNQEKQLPKCSRFW
ncbi:hypothetical protein BGZ73_007258 [Actinomortierella ambigua]|nr:hypothetical protein BGZ73_007258 [Actinomortierella ambigua]